MASSKLIDTIKRLLNVEDDISFLEKLTETADRIAQNLGIKRDYQVRAEAGVLYALYQLAEDGHVYYPYESLIEESKKILEVERDVIVKEYQGFLKNAGLSSKISTIHWSYLNPTIKPFIVSVTVPMAWWSL